MDGIAARPDGGSLVSHPPIMTIAALTVLTSLGQIGPYVAPFTLGALVKGVGLSTQAAAAAVSTEIACLALTLMALSRVLPLLNFRTIVIGGAALAALGQGISLVATDYPLLLGGRALAGVGNGATIAITYAIISASAYPARLFLIQAVGLAFIILIVFLALPYVVAVWGPRGQFLALAVLSLVCLPFALVIQNVPVAERPHGDRAVQRSPLWLISIGCVALFGAASNALWVHYEQIGELRHLSYQTLLLIPSATGFVFLLLPWVCLKVFERYRSFAPLSVATLLQIPLGGAYLLVPDLVVFIVAISGLNLLIVFQLTYARMLTSELDATGRLTGGVGGGDFIGSFAGPLVGGAFAASATDNTAFFATASVLFVASALISLFGDKVASRLRPASWR